MRKRLQAIPIRDSGDIRTYFEACAGRLDQHGDDGRLFTRRVELIRRFGGFRGHETVLDLGCGDGRYLHALAGDIGEGLGVDLAPGMVAAARTTSRMERTPAHIGFRVDDIERLASVASESIDVAFAVGVLEHVPDRPAALHSVRRTLKPGGRFVCLTPNGAAPLYRLAPRLGLETRRLSTDRYLTRRDLDGLLKETGFQHVDFAAWTFVPRGDLPSWLGGVLTGLDRLARRMGADILRGGLLASGMKAG